MGNFRHLQAKRAFWGFFAINPMLPITTYFKKKDACDKLVKRGDSKAYTSINEPHYAKAQHGSFDKHLS